MYSKHAQFDEKCTCGKPLAIHQRKFEKITTEKINEGMSLEDARIEAIKSLNIRKSCCLRDLTHFAKNLIFDTTINAYCNITSQISADKRINNINGKFIGIGAYEILPPTNNSECFDQLKYAEKLAKITMPAIDKSGFIRHGSGYPGVLLSFPNFSIVEKEDFPEVNYDVEPSTLDELIDIERNLP